MALSHTDNMVSEHEQISGRVLNKFVVSGSWFGEVQEGGIIPDGKTMYVSGDDDD